MREFFIKAVVIFFIFLPFWLFIDYQVLKNIGHDQFTGYSIGQLSGVIMFFSFGLIFNFIEFCLGYREAIKNKYLVCEKAIPDHIFNEIKEKMNEKRN